MFRCYFCDEVTQPKTKRHSVVISTRERVYPIRQRESRRGRGGFRSRHDAVQDGGGKGTETAREVSSCSACVEIQALVAERPDISLNELKQTFGKELSANALSTALHKVKLAISESAKAASTPETDEATSDS